MVKPVWSPATAAVNSSRQVNQIGTSMMPVAEDRPTVNSGFEKDEGDCENQRSPPACFQQRFGVEPVDAEQSWSHGRSKGVKYCWHTGSLLCWRL